MTALRLFPPKILVEKALKLPPDVNVNKTLILDGVFGKTLLKKRL